VLLIEPDETILIANRTLAERLGTTADAIIGKHGYDFAADDVAKWRKLHVDKVVRTGETVLFEDVGGTRNVLLSMYPVKDSTGRVTKVAVFGVDITERKKAEYELQESHKKYRDLVDNVTDGVYQIDTKGNFTYVNKVIEKRSGIPAEKFVGLNFRDVVIPEYHEIVSANLARFWAGEQVPPFELAYRTATGQTITVETNVRPIYDGNTITGIQGISRDITQRKKTERNLRESEEKYRQVVSTTTDAIMLFDAETRQFIEVNKACEELYGYSREEFLKLKHSDITAELEESDESIKKTLEGRLCKIPVRYHRKKDATVFPVEISAGIFELAGRRVLCGVVRDITQRKQAEERLKESERTLRSIIDSVTESVLLMELDGTVLVANRAVAGRLGTTVEGLTGKCVYDFLSADVSERRRVQAEKVVRTGESVIFEDMRGEKHILSSVNPIKDSTGKVIRMTIFALDVTHLVEIQEALRESELRYRSLFESSPVGLGLSTTDGKILDSNSTMCAITGYSNAEMMQVNLKDTYVNPGERAKLLKELQTNGLVRDFEVRLKRKDGTAYWASLSVIPFPFGGENTLLAAQVDITERKQAEEDLRDARNILRRIIDMLPVRVFWKNKDLKYLGGNEAFVKDAGLKSVDEIVGENDFDLVWKNQAELFRAGDKEVIETGRPKLTYQEPSTAPSGNAIWVNTSKVPLKNAEGETIGVLGVYSDITAQKQMQDALRQSENKYKTLLENLPQRVFLKDKNSVYISCSENYARDLRIKADQIVGKTDYDFYPKELAEKYKADDRRIVESGQTIDIEEKYILEGQEFIVHTVKTPVADEQGNVIGILGIFWDITDSKRRERELNLYREKITQTERLASLGTLSASVAHELTQPLTTIRLSIENSLVDLEATSCPADALDGLKDGLEGVEYAVSIIDRFRNFARQSSEKTVTEVELKEVAERILRLLDKNAQQADISLRLKDLERLPPIYANEKDMEQLFFAIVDNAIHAAIGKKNRQLTISGVVKGEHIELRFADNCGGIAPENVDKIFEPFFTTRPAGEGTGLGLPIVRHIVSRVGGRVWVQNNPGKGATFLVNLPAGKGMGS